MAKLSIKKVDTDIYFDNVSLLLPFNNNFNDNSKNKFSVTAYGNAQISSTQSKFAGSSAYFDGNGDYLVLEDNNAFNFNSGFDNSPSIPFTIEAWVYPLTLSSVTASGLISKDTYGSNFSWCIALYSDRIGVYTHNINGDWQFEANATVLTNTWQHVALSMDGTTQRLFLNGALIGTKNAPITNISSKITIGCLGWNNPNYFYNGYINDLRITKGMARYTSNFTPPGKFIRVGNKLQISNPLSPIQSSAYIRDTVLPILKSSITNFYEYSYDGDNSSIGDGGNDMYDGGNTVILNGVAQIYDTESANTFCYRSYPFIYKTTQTSNFTLSVQGNYGSDGGETMYQYQQDFDYQGRKFSIYISENIDYEDASIVECFIVLYPNNKPTINFTFSTSGDGEGNETINVSNLNGQSVTAFYLLLSNYPPVQIGSVTLFDVLKTFVVNCTIYTYNKKLRIKAPLPFPKNGLLVFWNLNNADGLSTIPADYGSYTLQVGYFGYQSAAGKVNNCFYFADGSKGLFTNQQILNQTNDPQSFSCAFWYKTPNSTNYVFTCGSAYGSLGFHFDYLGTQYEDSYGLGMKFSVATGNENDGNSWGSLTVGSLFDANTWYHVVGTYDLSSQTMKLYVNGSLVGTLNGVVSSGNEHPDWHGFGLNGSALSYGKEYGGNQYLDAVGIWNKALTESEIAQLYNSGSGLEY